MKRNFILSLMVMFCCPFLFAQNENEADKYERMVVIEEFTTENCPKCPRVAKIIEDFLNDSTKSSNAIVVTHHAGFGQDWLTTEADYDFTWFYNSYGTYAPAMMFDRYPFFNDNGNITPVAFVSNTSDLRKFYNMRMRTASHVAFDIMGEYDNDSKVKVTVRGERNADFSKTPAHITVFIQEDNVQSEDQAGAGPSYKHNHVYRTYNSIWGDEIVWNGDNFEYECTLTLDPTWKKENLHVTAFVSAFDKENATDCVIENARTIPFSMTNGINDTNVEKKVIRTEYFTTDGIKTTLNTKGVYVVRNTYSDGTFGVKKISL